MVGSEDSEEILQQIVRLLVYVYKMLGKNPEKWVVAETDDAETKHERCVILLCAELKKMDQSQLDVIVYNARNKDARDLANWWEEHQEADRVREERERKKEHRKALRKQAKRKLSKEEQVALGLKK